MTDECSVTRGRGGGRGSGVARWLLPASLLHVALGLLASRLQPLPAAPAAAHSWPIAVGSRVSAQLPASAASPQASAHSRSAESIVELTLLEEEDAAKAIASALASLDAARSVSPAAGAALASLDERRSSRAERTQQMPSIAPASDSGAGPAGAPADGGLARAARAVNSAPLPDSPVAQRSARAGAPGEVEAHHLDTETTASSAPAPGAGSSGLSLEQLGIGTQPFMAAPGAPLAAASPPRSPLSAGPFGEAPLSDAERANQRLQASLHGPPLAAEHQRGLGPEGPVVAAARRLVSADEMLLETSAVLNVRIDGGGRVTEVHVSGASSQHAAWQMIAARLMKDLTPLALRRPGSNQGWDVKLRLASAVQLPSGAAPGLRTDVLGQVLPGSSAPGATSLSLSPTSPLRMPDPPIDPIGRHMDRVMTVELGLLKLKGDVADLAAVARRVVHVAVLSVDEAATP